MDFIERYKSDPEFKKKALIGGGMGIVGIIILLAGIFVSGQENEENKPVQQVEAIQNYSNTQLDTTLIKKGTSDYRRMEFQKDTILDKMNTSYIKTEGQEAYMHNASGAPVVTSNGSVVNNGGNAGGGNALNEYMRRRNQSIERVYNSQPSTPVVVPTTPQREMVVRGYEPRANNIQSYSTPTPVNQDYIVSTPTTQNQSTTPKVLTKEEKLQQAIASKYNSTNSQKANVTAQVYNNQKINSNNTSVRLLLKDKLYYNNVVIGTDAFVYGNASVNGDKVTINVPSITYKGNNYPVNLTVYDYRTGIKGIPVKMDNIVGVAGDVVETQAQQQISRYGGKVGQVLSQVISGRNKSASIQLNDGHLVYLRTQ